MQIGKTQFSMTRTPEDKSGREYEGHRDPLVGHVEDADGLNAGGIMRPGSHRMHHAVLHPIFKVGQLRPIHFTHYNHPMTGVHER